MTDGVGANGADGGNGITQRSRETEVEQRTVFSVCVSVAPFLCVIPLPPCSPFTHARELEQCRRRERSVIEIAAARRNQRIHEGSSACVRHRAPGADAGRAPAEIQPKSRVFGLGCTNRECSPPASPRRDVAASYCGPAVASAKAGTPARTDADTEPRIPLCSAPCGRRRSLPALPPYPPYLPYLPRSERHLSPELQQPALQHVGRPQPLRSIGLVV